MTETGFERMMSRLGADLAQTKEQMPVRVFMMPQKVTRPGELALWAEDGRVWASYDSKKVLVSASEIISLLLSISGDAVWPRE